AVAFPSVPQPDPSTDPSLVPKSVEEEKKKSEGEGAERKKEKEEEEEEEPKQKLDEEMDGRENSVDGQVVSVGKVDSRGGEMRRDSVLGEGYERTTGCDDRERDGTAAVENQEPITAEDENTVVGHASREVNKPMKNGPVPNDSDTTDTPTRRKRSSWGRRRSRRRMRSAGETTDGEDEEERQPQQPQPQQNEHQMPLVSTNNKRAPEDDDPLHHQTKKHITSPSGERQGQGQQQQEEEEEAMVVVAEGKVAGTGTGTETPKVEPTKKRAGRAWGRKGSRPQLVSLEGSKVMTAAMTPAAPSSVGVSSEVRQGGRVERDGQTPTPPAEQVASTGENLNIADSLEVEKGSSGNVRSMLAMPIRNRNFQIIGVAKIINKLNGQPFDENDEQLFEAFTIFCGLGINNTMMYNELEKAMARQKVAIEVLSYHATASNEEIQGLQREVVPEAIKWNLGSLTFDDFSLTQDQMVLAAVRMFSDLRLTSRFKIEYKTLLRWLITVKRNYRNVPYHNWRHAFNVAHNMFAMLKTCNLLGVFEDMEILAMFVGCLCHDLDHRGTNNSFQEKTGSALALLYGTQNTMEQHHFNHAVMILNSEGHNIFSNLSSAQYSRVMNVLKQSILATDLTVYFQVRMEFFSLVNEGDFDMTQKEHRELLRSLLMTGCDIAASTKPWDIQFNQVFNHSYRVAKLVTSEFFDQGDLEKTKLKITPPALMDRDRKHELPLLQMRWIKDICLPLFEGLTKVVPNLALMRDGALRNMAKWSKLAATSQENNGTTTDILEHCHSLERGPSIDPPPEAPPKIPDG
ncbi:hypothetical protein Pmani_004338, partial [Petrolisthes manimaculis]